MNTLSTTTLIVIAIVQGFVGAAVALLIRAGRRQPRTLSPGTGALVNARTPDFSLERPADPPVSIMVLHPEDLRILSMAVREYHHALDDMPGLERERILSYNLIQLLEDEYAELRFLMERRGEQ